MSCCASVAAAGATGSAAVARRRSFARPPVRPTQPGWLASRGTAKPSRAGRRLWLLFARPDRGTLDSSLVRSFVCPSVRALVECARSHAAPLNSPVCLPVCFAARRHADASSRLASRQTAVCVESSSCGQFADGLLDAGHAPLLSRRSLRPPVDWGGLWIRAGRRRRFMPRANEWQTSPAPCSSPSDSRRSGRPLMGADQSERPSDCFRTERNETKQNEEESFFKCTARAKRRQRLRLNFGPLCGATGPQTAQVQA